MYKYNANFYRNVLYTLKKDKGNLPKYNSGSLWMVRL